MKNLLFVFAFLFSLGAQAGNITGSANQVMRIPSGGGVGKYGQVDVSSSAAVTGVLAAANGGPSGPSILWNCSLSASVATSALTISLKDASGATPSASSPCRVGFRNATSATGTYSVVSVTSATSLVISSGSTLGFASGAAHYIYIYAINNAGTLELSAGQPFWDEDEVQSTTAEGGAGAADSNAVQYSTSARSNVPVHLIGRMKLTEATAGTWATAPSQIKVGYVEKIGPVAYYETQVGSTASSATKRVFSASGKVEDNFNVFDDANDRLIAPMPGLYMVCGQGRFGTGPGYALAVTNYINGIGRNAMTQTSANASNITVATGCEPIRLAVGDYTELWLYSDTNISTNNSYFSFKWISF